MIPHLRKRFNSNFTPAKYQDFLEGLDLACGTHVKFRNSETPCFLPKPLVDRMAVAGEEIVRQLVDNAEYQSRAQREIPPEFRIPGATDHPLFVQVDFGLMRAPNGEIEPKLVEVQGFPSLYAYQVLIALQYQRSYGLDAGLRFLPAGLDLDSYYDLLRRAILGNHNPANVVLLEIDPYEQKTLPDFLLTEQIAGIKIVNAFDVIQQGRRVFYQDSGRLVPIHRFYNRLIFDELARKGKALPFDLTSDLEVEWADHPSWFYRISKLSIPFLRHPTVPETRFLNEIDPLPDDLEHYVLKPLYSFAGLGVVLGPTCEQIAAILPEKRAEFILQERLSFEPVIDTPCGPTKVEVRVMYLWLDDLRPGALLLRMGRGQMMGVDYNRDMDWVGSSAGFYPAG
ncbi:MAG TPA: hypothetical protein VG206_16720 [Terriglobia bacterium]|nr:hypothetical protein [Terriglobia bacterium]